MDALEIAWLAGLLEGEGCFCLRANGSSFINCSMTDEDTVRRVHEITKAGTVTTPALRPGCKQVWAWRTGAREDVIRICNAVLPYMGQRRSAKIRELLADYEQYPRYRARRGTKVHGLRNTYLKGCRCASCKSADRKYVSDLKIRRNNGTVGRKGVSTKSLDERIADANTVL